jgi:hypothetical protein
MPAFAASFTVTVHSIVPAGFANSETYELSALSPYCRSNFRLQTKYLHRFTESYRSASGSPKDQTLRYRPNRISHFGDIELFP